MTDLSKEYRIVSEAAGWRRSTRRSVMAILGRDAAPFLHALVTADVGGLAPGAGAYAAYLTPQGRMICDLALYRKDDGWLADVPAATAASIAAKLDASIFSEDVRVEDRSARMAILSVVGPKSAALLARLDGADRSHIDALPLRGGADAGAVTVARTDAAMLPSFDLLLPAHAVASTVEILGSAGAVAMSDELAEFLRIQAGRPAFGLDMDTDTIPLEAGLLDRAISTTKGCYVGQEIIIRVLHRGGGRVARRLMKMEGRQAASAIAAGAAIIADGRDVGIVTSTARDPERDRAIALGYVHRDAAIEGQDVLIRHERAEVPAVIVGAAG